ncbi:hypothetical protein EDB84DRAFT_1442520 [Lactarius hengduanensis]|nr:hypothetical protein EDB84DRAFT_1442520 [Lactarius hengduanensis]
MAGKSRLDAKHIDARSGAVDVTTSEVPQTINRREAVLWSSSSPARARALPLPPTPMEEDFDYALEVWADTTAAKNGGIYDSDHAPAPIAQPSPIPARNPSAPPQVTALAAQAEQSTTAPLPGAVEPQPAELADPVPAPPAAAPTDGLAQLIAALNDTISRLDAKLDAGLEAQNKRIDALFAPRDPRPEPVKAQAAKAKETVAASPAPNTVHASSSAAMDETPSRMARVDDPADEPITELFTEGTTLPLHRDDTTVIREAFQPPADKLVRLETDARGKPTPTATMPVSWAGVVTQSSAHQQASASAHARNMNQTMGRTNGGKSRPETAARRSASTNTDVMTGTGTDPSVHPLAPKPDRADRSRSHPVAGFSKDRSERSKPAHPEPVPTGHGPTATAGITI